MKSISILYLRNVFFILLAGSLFFQCQKTIQPPIGVLMDEYTNTRWLKDSTFLAEALRKQNAKVFMRSSLGDPDLQLDQAKELLNQGVRIFLLIPSDAEKAAEIVETIQDAGGQVIAYDRLVKNANVDYFISFDNVQVGYLQASSLLRRVNTGNYALLGGATYDNNSYQLKEGQRKAMQPYVEDGGVRVIFDEFSKDWRVEDGEDMVRMAFENGEENLDAVVASNDNLAIGAANVLWPLRQPGESLFISGQDATLESIQNILEGKQYMTVYKPIEALAYTAAIAAVRLYKMRPLHQATASTNNGLKDVPSILLQPLPVYKGNIEFTVLADGHIIEGDLGENWRDKLKNQSTLDYYMDEEDDDDYSFDDDNDDDDMSVEVEDGEIDFDDLDWDF